MNRIVNSCTLKIRGGCDRDANCMREAIGLDFQNCLQTGDKAMTLTGGRIDGHSVPCVLIQGECYSLDEKMGQTYVHRECANTLAQRDYKQPQAVIYELPREDRTVDGE